MKQIRAHLNLPRARRGKSRASLKIIAAAYEFLLAQNPTSVRGVCYHLFTRRIIPSMAKLQTDKVSRLLRDARECGSIPWEWIVDETRELERASSWSNPASFVQTVRHAYRRDFWEHQATRLEVWSEKGTVRGVLHPVLSNYGVGFRVMHGFGSATAIHDVATDDSGGLIALYVGDFDPSGLCISERDLPDRLSRYGGDHVTLKRIALLESDTLGLPFFPANDKRKDPRYRWFVDNYGARCWELDAMGPNDLRRRVEDAIREEIDFDAWRRCEVAQEAEQASLECVLDTWGAHTAR